jgi:hypothetical protein
MPPSQDPEREAALDSIEEIRSILIRSTRYTQISALGILLAGIAACAAALAGWALDVSAQENATAFLGLWVCALVTSFAFGVLTSWRKARIERESFWNRKLGFVAAGFAPASIVGLIFTVLLTQTGRLDLAPGVWMALYGVGILAVSTVLDWEFQVTAWAFLVASAAALFPLRTWTHLSLLLSFGFIHLLLGAYRVVKDRGDPSRRA